MFFLISAIICSSVIFILFRVFEKLRVNVFSAITVNYLVASLLGILTLTDKTSAEFFTFKPWLIVALLSGFTLIATFYVYGLSVQKVGMAITGVSGKMSVIIPVVFGFTMFNEPYEIPKIIGIAMALFSFYLVLLKGQNQKKDIKFIILPVLLFIGNGANDTLFKIFQEFYPSENDAWFLIIAFTFSFFIGVLVFLVLLVSKKVMLDVRSMIAGILLGILNWFSTYFFLKGIEVFDISMFVPVFNAAIIVIAAANGYVFFRERLTSINLAGIVLAIISITIIAVF